MFLKRLVHKLGRAYINKIIEIDTDHKFRRHNERSIEYRFVFDSLTTLHPITVLDVGTGTTALPALIATCGCVVTAIDNVRDYWQSEMMNRHWRVIDDDKTHPRISARFDLIACISVIEHIEDHLTAFQSMLKLLTPGGHLILTTPYNEQRSVANVYELPRAAYGQSLPYICRSTSRREVDDWLRSTGAEIVRQEFWEFWSGEGTQGTALARPRQVTAADSHQLTCMSVRKPT